MPTLHAIAQAAVIPLLALSARLVLAQQPADRPNQCSPSPRAPHASQQAHTDVFATLAPARDSADAPAMYLATLLQEVRLAFAAPGSIVTLSDGVMSVWLHGDGRLTNPRAADSLLSSELIGALTAAIDSVSRRGGIGPVFPQLQADSVELRLVVHYAAQQTPLSLPFLRVALPPAYFEFQVETPARPTPGGPAPTYPAHLRESAIDGDVLALFVVDERGLPEMRTLKILKSSHRDFTRAVREVLPRLRFHPAELAGCKVRQVVQIPFSFRINR